MMAAERKNRILSKLRLEGKVAVAPLGAEFGVSEETIRRDLEKLEKEGHAKRTYGGAILDASAVNLPYFLSRQTNVEENRKLAAGVAGLIKDGDFIMLDDSTTSTFVARAIRGRRNITLITNSIEILLELSDVEGWRIMSTGGELKPNALALTGFQAKKLVESYRVDKAVISCTAVNIERGCTDANEDKALIKRAMMNSADATILAVGGRKLGKRAFATISSLRELATLVTDAEPDSSWRRALEKSGVELVF